MPFSHSFIHSLVRSLFIAYDVSILLVQLPIVPETSLNALSILSTTMMVAWQPPTNREFYYGAASDHSLLTPRGRDAVNWNGRVSNHGATKTNYIFEIRRVRLTTSSAPGERQEWFRATC